MYVLCACRYIFADIHVYISFFFSAQKNVRCTLMDNWTVLGVTHVLFPRGLLLATVGDRMLLCGLTQSRQSPFFIFFVFIVGSKNSQFCIKI